MRESHRIIVHQKVCAKLLQHNCDNTVSGEIMGS